MPAAYPMVPTAEWARIRRAREGDDASFEDLYRAHAGRVFALLARMCGDRGRAEDLTQEVFVKAWRQLGSFRGESQFSSWLHRLAVNVALGDRRSRDRRLDPSRAATDDLSAIPARDSGAGAGAGRDLESAIAALPPGAREVLVLHDIEGYKHEEIAAMTGRSAGTCRAQLHRARALLRETLG